MNKSDLIQHITQSLLQKDGIYEQLRPTDVKEAVYRILETLTEALAENRISKSGTSDLSISVRDSPERGATPKPVNPSGCPPKKPSTSNQVTRCAPR